MKITNNDTAIASNQLKFGAQTLAQSCRDKKLSQLIGRLSALPETEQLDLLHPLECIAMIVGVVNAASDARDKRTALVGKYRSLVKRNIETLDSAYKPRVSFWRALFGRTSHPASGIILAIYKRAEELIVNQIEYQRPPR